MRAFVGVPEIWGIVNVTPDSFSDGGLYAEPGAAVAHALALAAQGADVLDVGGESTRPGADPISEAEERRRVVPVIERLREAGLSLPISVDTRRAGVARAALEAGATIVNDVSAGRDAAMFPLVADREAGLVVMHMRGDPPDMQAGPTYADVVAEVGRFLDERCGAAEAAGVVRSRILADPGIGFGKTLAHNLELLRRLEALRAMVPGVRWLVGASRKSFLGTLTGGRPAPERVAASLACAVRAFVAGVDAVRVHDVAETRDALTVYAQLR